MADTKVDICARALIMIGAQPISSFDDGSTLIVVSVKNSGPDFVNIRFAAATRLTPLFFGIVSNIGLTTDL